MKAKKMTNFRQDATYGCTRLFLGFPLLFTVFMRFKILEVALTSNSGVHCSVHPGPIDSMNGFGIERFSPSDSVITDGEWNAMSHAAPSPRLNIVINDEEDEEGDVPVPPPILRNWEMTLLQSLLRAKLSRKRKEHPQ